jgi:hypothetical protein
VAQRENRAAKDDSDAAATRFTIRAITEEKYSTTSVKCTQSDHHDMEENESCNDLHDLLTGQFLPDWFSSRCDPWRTESVLLRKPIDRSDM